MVGCRKDHSEGGAFVWVCRGPDGAPVNLNDALGSCQAETAADDAEVETADVAEATEEPEVEAAGGTLDDICRVDVYVRNMEHFDQIHAVRREYFSEPLPASTMVEVTKMTTPDALVEINAIAVVA